jgi:hypothetical protein
MLLSACSAEAVDAPIDESELGSVQQQLGGFGAVRSRYWNANVRCLDVPGGNFYQGARIQQWGCNYTEAQRFLLSENGDGSVSLSHQVPGYASLALDVAGASKDNGAPVQLWYSNLTGAQKFWKIDTGSGHFALKNVNSGKCLDLTAWPDSPFGSSKLQQWDCHWGYNQQFWFDRWY